MAAPMRNAFCDFGQKIIKFQLSLPSYSTQRQFILCKQCSLRNSLLLKQCKTRDKGYFRKKSVVNLTARQRGDNSSTFWCLDSAENDSYTYRNYRRSLENNSISTLFGQKRVYNIKFRPICSSTRWSCIQRENVSSPDKAEDVVN